MELIDKYAFYKRKYSDSIVFIKDGCFYRTFYEDAKVMWYLFDYKCINDSVFFSDSSYIMVLSRLNKLDIGYVIIDNDKEVLFSFEDKDSYRSYVSLATRGYQKEAMGQELFEKLKKVIEYYPESYERLNELLDEYLLGDENS